MTTMMMIRPKAVCTLLALLAAATGQVQATIIQNYPVGITNCHFSQWFDKAPERTLVASSGALEIMLAMGLGDHVVASSWVKEVWEPLNEEFQKFEHFDKYPSAQEILGFDIDFIYATYSSAFENPSDPDRVVGGDRVNYTEFLGVEDCELLIASNSYGENKTYCRQEIHATGIRTYLQSSYCELADYRPADVSVDALYQEVWDIGTIFGKIDASRALVDGIEDRFAQALAVSQNAPVGAEKSPEPLRVFWLDTYQTKSRPDDKRPFVGACCGGPQIVLDHAGAVNVFENQGVDDRRIWDRVEWDQVVEADPDLIVLIELSTESAEEKLYKLCSDPLLREMRAVQERQFLVLPFAASNIGVRLGATAYNLAEAMVALARGSPLNALQFTQNEDESEAVSLSGIKVWTTLPKFNGTDLNTFCPGAPTALDIRELADAEEQGLAQNDGDDDLPSWAIALIAIFGAGFVALAVFMMMVVSREKKGDPMFAPIMKPGSSTA